METHFNTDYRRMYVQGAGPEKAAYHVKRLMDNELGVGLSVRPGNNGSYRLIGGVSGEEFYTVRKKGRNSCIVPSGRSPKTKKAARTYLEELLTQNLREMDARSRKRD